MIYRIIKGAAAALAGAALLTIAGCGANDVYLPGNPDGPKKFKASIRTVIPTGRRSTAR